jgi:DNA-binding response OmpR family regulator
MSDMQQNACRVAYRGVNTNDPQHLPPVVVLIAEDDAIICNLVRIALEATGMFVLTASDGRQALALSRKFPGTIHALVSDIVMPNLDGLGLCDQILRERPAIKVLLMSASCDPVDGIPFLHKPFKLEELKQKVRRLVSG